MLCMRDMEHGHMKEEHTREGDAKMIKYTCEYPGCGFARKDLETDEHLNLREGIDINDRYLSLF
jgi:hypothetical protein